MFDWVLSTPLCKSWACDEIEYFDQKIILFCTAKREKESHIIALAVKLNPNIKSKEAKL